MKHILYGFLLGFQHRKRLREVIGSAVENRSQVTTLTVSEMEERDIHCLILDFDGVLAAHGEGELEPEVVPWLQGMVKRFQAGKVFILSNKPSEERKHYFAEAFPEVQFIKAPRKKPYTDGIDICLAQSEVKPEQAIIADDRLLTGVMAGLSAGIRVAYITRPYRKPAKRLWSETFFSFLRVTEKWYVRLLP